MKIFILMCIFTLLSISNLSAQWDNNIVCPGDSSHCAWADTVVDRKVQLSFKHDQYAYVTYRYRICNGVLEIDILSITTIDNAGDLRTFSIEHYEFKALRSAVELGVMTDHEREIGIPGLPTLIPGKMDYSCTDTVTYVNFFTASCGIFVNCTYERSTTSRDCDRGYEPPYPEYDSSFVKKVIYQKWQPCGYNCCKKRFRVCRDMSSTGGVTGNSEARSVILRIVESEITSVTDCSLQSNYGSKPCYTNCWNNP